MTIHHTNPVLSTLHTLVSFPASLEVYIPLSTVCFVCSVCCHFHPVSICTAKLSALPLLRPPTNRTDPYLSEHAIPLHNTPLHAFTYLNVSLIHLNAHIPRDPTSATHPIVYQSHVRLFTFRGRCASGHEISDASLSCAQA